MAHGKEAYVQRYPLERRRFVAEDQHEPAQLFDLYYAKRRGDIQKEANSLLRAMKEETKSPGIDMARHEMMPARNNWLKILEAEAKKEKEIPETQQFMRKIIPTFYTWDEYKIYLHVWRSDFSYGHVKEAVSNQAPLHDNKVEVMAVIESTETIEPFSIDHMNLMESNNFNIFLLCVPEIFVIRIRRQTTGDYTDILVSASPLDTVKDLKKAIRGQKGYPIQRMDLVYKGYTMENNQRLLMYDLQDGSLVNMVLQLGHPMRVKAACFWNHVYDLQIDSTTTAREFLQLVMRQCVSPYCGQFYINENFIHPDFLSVESPRQYHFGLDECLHRALRQENSAHVVVNAKRNNQPLFLNVHNCPEGTESIQVDMEGHYGVAYLRLHGLIGTTVDNMSLRVEGSNLNPYDGVSTDRDGIDVIVDLTDKHEVVQRKLLVFVVMETGAVQPLYLNIRHTFAELKEFLINMGYACFTYSNIWFKDRIMPIKMSLLDARVKPKDYLHIVAMEFPVFITSINGYQKTLQIHGRSRMTSIIERSDKLFPPTHGQSEYVFNGQVIDSKLSALDAGIQPGNRIFQELKDKQIILEVLYYNDKVTLELKPNFYHFDERSKFREWRLPSSTMDSLEQLIMWRIAKPTVTEKRPKPKPIKVDEEMLDNPRLRPTIDYAKLARQQKKCDSKCRNKPVKLEASAPAPNNVKVELPPMKLNRVPRTVEFNRDEGLQSLLIEKKVAR